MPKILKDEVWKKVKGFEWAYEVSNFGRVKSLTRKVKHSLFGEQLWKGKILTPNKYRSGHLYVQLLDRNNKRHIFGIHQLVALNFLGYKENCEINHKDGNPANNRLENLEWVSHSRNIKHAYEIGLSKRKITKEQEKELKKMFEQGIKRSIIAEKFNLSIGGVYWIARGYKKNVTIRKTA